MLLPIIVGVLAGLAAGFGVLLVFGLILSLVMRLLTDHRISVWKGLLVQLLAILFTSAINIPLFLMIDGPGAFSPAEQADLFPWGEILRSQAIALPATVIGMMASLKLLVKLGLKENAIVTAVYLTIIYLINAGMYLGLAGLLALVS